MVPSYKRKCKKITMLHEEKGTKDVNYTVFQTFYVCSIISCFNRALNIFRNNRLPFMSDDECFFYFLCWMEEVVRPQATCRFFFANHPLYNVWWMFWTYFGFLRLLSRFPFNLSQHIPLEGLKFNSVFGALKLESRLSNVNVIK